MLLSVRILANVASANEFDYVDQQAYTQGDAPKIYFQLVDLTQDLPTKGFQPSGKRYCPQPGADNAQTPPSLQVTVTNIDSAIQIVRYAARAFPNQDSSIWSLQISTTDKLTGSSDLRLRLTEVTSNTSTKVTNGVAKAAVAISPSGDF